MGAPWLSLYPRSGDICLGDREETLDLLAFARLRGLKVKTVTSGVSAGGVEALLPYLSKLTVSVDALEEAEYAVFRPAAAHRNLLETLSLLADARRLRADLSLTALVMAGRSTLGSIERRVASIAQLGLFHKIKLLELLPLGGGTALWDETLSRRRDLARLAAIRSAYSGSGIRIGTPLWRVKEGRRGCRLGQKDLAIGPQGQVAGCTLLLYLGETLADARNSSLAEIWHNAFGRFREQKPRPPTPLCGGCPFFKRNLCSGGCLARVHLFGGAAERARSCGVTGPASARDLYARYLRHLDTGSTEPFTHSTGAEAEFSDRGECGTDSLAMAG